MQEACLFFLHLNVVLCQRGPIELKSQSCMSMVERMLTTTLNGPLQAQNLALSGGYRSRRWGRIQARGGRSFKGSGHLGTGAPAQRASSRSELEFVNSAPFVCQGYDTPDFLMNCLANPHIRADLRKSDPRRSAPVPSSGPCKS